MAQMQTIVGVIGIEGGFGNHERIRIDELNSIFSAQGFELGIQLDYQGIEPDTHNGVGNIRIDGQDALDMDFSERSFCFDNIEDLPVISDYGIWRISSTYIADTNEDKYLVGFMG